MVGCSGAPVRPTTHCRRNHLHRWYKPSRWRHSSGMEPGHVPVVARKSQGTWILGSAMLYLNVPSWSKLSHGYNPTHPRQIPEVSRSFLWSHREVWTLVLPRTVYDQSRPFPRRTKLFPRYECAPKYSTYHSTWLHLHSTCPMMEHWQGALNGPPRRCPLSCNETRLRRGKHQEQGRGPVPSCIQNRGIDDIDIDGFSLILGPKFSTILMTSIASVVD